MRARGLEGSEAEGWTVSMAQADEFFDLNGQDFVLDVVAELETPPAFPNGMSPSRNGVSLLLFELF